jgi:hypothetical protein
MGGPYKICNDTAQFIKDVAVPASIIKIKLPSYAIGATKKCAREDFLDHQAYDPEYNLGGGSANLIDKTMQEVEGLQRSGERLG